MQEDESSSSGSFGSFGKRLIRRAVRSMDMPRLSAYNVHAKTVLNRSPQRLPPCSAPSTFFENGGARWYDICNAEKNVGGREEEDLPPAGNTIVRRVSLVWHDLDVYALAARCSCG